MDFGFPQTTEDKILKNYICVKDRFLIKTIKPPSTVTNAVNWRDEGIIHSKNEIYMDVIEKINLMVNENGEILQSEIEGDIEMKSFLSGMPELKLGLNDYIVSPTNFSIYKNTRERKTTNVELNDVKFHQCVRLSKFERDRTISFIPPDGKFNLMSYRITTYVHPPFQVKIISNYRPEKGVDYDVSIKSEFKRVSCANNVSVIVPTPSFADSPRFVSDIGSAKHNTEESNFVWSIKQLNGHSRHVLKAKFGLPKIVSESEENEGRSKIQFGTVRFEIPYYTVSGVQVQYLKIMEKSGYNALPWVRYATRSGNYIVRINVININ